MTIVCYETLFIKVINEELWLSLKSTNSKPIAEIISVIGINQEKEVTHMDY